MAIEAAVRIVTEEGAAGLSTRKVAGRIGYTVGTLYHVFRNLDDLILHVNARTLDSLYADMQRVRRECPDPKDCLLALGQTYWQFARRHTERWSLLFTHRLRHGEKPPQWFDRRVQAVHALVEEAIAAYAPAQEQAAVVATARTLWGAVHGICVLALSEKFGDARTADARSLLDNLFSHYLAGLAAGAGSNAHGGGAG